MHVVHCHWEVGGIKVGNLVMKCGFTISSTSKSASIWISYDILLNHHSQFSDTLTDCVSSTKWLVVFVTTQQVWF